MHGSDTYCLDVFQECTSEANYRSLAFCTGSARLVGVESGINDFLVPREVEGVLGGDVKRVDDNTRKREAFVRCWDTLDFPWGEQFTAGESIREPVD